MIIRHAKIEDVDTISKIESECFPESEAASYKNIKERILKYGNHFYLLIIDNTIVSFINGMCSNENELVDEMYEDVNMHNEDGKNYFIFSVCTNIKYQHKGYASILMKEVIKDCKNRENIILTCKEALLPFYESFGYINEGVSISTHGNVKWYQMKLKIKDVQ